MMYHFIAKKPPSDLHIIAVKYGLLMFAGFVTYFLLIYLIGLGNHSELRLFNGVIQIYCLHRAIQTYYQLHPENMTNYLYGVVEGLKASAIGVGIFSIFMTIFLSIDTNLMNSIRQSSLMGQYLNPFTANLFVLTEGLTVGLILSYILTRIQELRMSKE